MTDNTVKFGESFYLRHSTGQYLIAVDRGQYNYPQLGNTGKVTLQVVGNEGEVVTSSGRIKIRTTESVIGNNDILGAFANSHDCYYWQDGYDEDKQSWLITKVSGTGGPIHYADQVYLTNCSYGTQLCPDTSNLGYITTAENTTNWWILESTVPVSSPAQESSSPPTASSAIPSQLATAPPNVAPSPSAPSEQSAAPVITQVGPVGSASSVVEQPGQPATAPPNVAPSPPAPTAPSDTPSIPAPVSSVGQPSQPAVTQGRQKVLVFDANHQGIAVGGGALRPQGRFTIEAWVCPATAAGKQVILAEGETLFYLEGGELKFQIAPAAEAIASVGAGLVAGNWYHVAVVRAGSRLGATKLYINGIQNDNQIAISAVLTFGNTYLGGKPDKPEYRFQGKLLEVRIWRFARSQEDIEANRLYPLTGRELGLVRYWPLNETVGTTLHNKSTSPAVGTVSGEAVWEEVEIPLKLKLDPQEKLLQSTGLEDYAYWYRVIAKQQEPVTDPSFRRGRIWT